MRNSARKEAQLKIEGSVCRVELYLRITMHCEEKKLGKYQVKKNKSHMCKERFPLKGGYLYKKIVLYDFAPNFPIFF